MIERLRLHNFPSGYELNLTEHNNFILKTCQRTMVLSAGQGEAVNVKGPVAYSSEHQAEDAYLFMLETICGLKSKLLGENEIVGQFKQAFKSFLENPNRDNSLIVILEKLFKDAKDIRTKYLLGLSQKTYASITRKIIQSSSTNLDEVLIIGSGNLAEDLINQFKKKCKVTICARNLERLSEFKIIHGVDILPWDQVQNTTKYSYIVNTIGFEGVLFDKNFFSNWKSYSSDGVFVDLGSPSVIQSNLKKEHGLWRLEDIFTEGAFHENFKWNQISLAKEAMKSTVEKRKITFKKKMMAKKSFEQGARLELQN